MERPRGKIVDNNYTHVVLSAGHTPGSPGATSPCCGLREHDLNWETLKAVVRELKAANSTLVVTVLPRLWDLRRKIKWLEDYTKGDSSTLFLEIHHNAFNTKAHGTECFYRHGDLRAFRVGSGIVNSLSKELGLRNRGMKLGAKSARGSLGWLKRDGCLLLEVYFMDNPMDRELGELQRVGNIIAQSLIKWAP